MESVYINGKGAGATWGVTLLDGSIAALLTPPAAKSRITNNCRLKNGTQSVVKTKDGSSLVRFQSRDVILNFSFSASGYVDLEQKQAAFLAELMNGTVALKVPQLPDKVYHLDYVSSTFYGQLLGKLAKLAVKFNEPDPTARS